MAKADLTMTEGEDWVRRLTFKDSLAAPVLLGSDARVRIGFAGSGTASVELTVGDGLTQDDGGATLVLELPSEVTSSLPSPNLQFDLFATVNGRWIAVIPSRDGSITVDPGIRAVP